MFSGVTSSDSGTETDGLVKPISEKVRLSCCLLNSYLSSSPVFPFWGHGMGTHMGPFLHEFIKGLCVSICGLPCSRTPWQCSEGAQVEESSRTPSEHFHVLPVPSFARTLSSSSNPLLLRPVPIIIINH